MASDLEGHVITTVNNITKALDRGLQTDIIFLDLSKAFDKVPHHHLCIYMRITHKHNSVLYNYTIENTAIQQVSLTKYLGITISNYLTWSTHINKITSRALLIKAFLQRNLKSCPAHVKLKCYNTMIRPILEYASPVWSPHTRKDIEKLEQVQRYSARFIMADYSRFSSVSNMLSNLNFTSLEIRRQVSSTILFYKT